ncbi:MAG: hypothetical protein AB1489_39760 [Acidobacteriota bacterium]
MKLTFLGGADEIGASSTLLEIAGARILIDYGLRHHEIAGERLLALVAITGNLDATILLINSLSTGIMERPLGIYT